MSIAFISTRELSRQPGRVLARVKKQGPQIITQNGVPSAVIFPASPQGIEADVEAIRRLLFGQAVDALRASAAISGTADTSMEDIDAEIAAARTERRKSRRRA